MILAGITISLVFSENGIITKAREAAEKTNQAVINEQAQMNDVTAAMENMLNGAGGSGTTPEEPEPELPSDGSYSESKGVNTPNLGEGMTAIKWDETANSGAGDWVETDGSMWVWIPRFAYSITSGYHSSSTGTIAVEFMKGTRNETTSGRTSFNNASGQGNWNIHPAFNYGQTVSGIWVAKFEASQSNASASSNTGTTNDYTSTQGVKASTTGNVYGVYDMSGGAWEYVAAYVNNGNSSLTSYGNSLYTSTDSKTKNVYAKGSSDSRENNYSANAGVYGDAVYETSTSGSGTTSWYSDSSNFPYADGPFFGRGGYYSDSSIASVFYFFWDVGSDGSGISFRPVLVALRYNEKFKRRIFLLKKYVYGHIIGSIKEV